MTSSVLTDTVQHFYGPHVNLKTCHYKM